ncbi:MAG: hypothetical protein M5R37_15205 [Melioribacteraceae bacterium]|nr:hypothetical protein [Melioribacteraceae bacterium]
MIINPEGVKLILEYWKDGKLESWNEALGINSGERSRQVGMWLLD